MIRLNQNKRKFQSILIFNEKIGFIQEPVTFFELRETIRLYKTVKTT